MLQVSIIQGLELSLLKTSENYLLESRIKRSLIGTHSEDTHQRGANMLIRNDYHILYDAHETKWQPDGIFLDECNQK